MGAHEKLQGARLDAADKDLKIKEAELRLSDAEKKEAELSKTFEDISAKHKSAERETQLAFSSLQRLMSAGVSAGAGAGAGAGEDSGGGSAAAAPAHGTKRKRTWW
jgi:multidrug resistance efflux pump